MDSTASWQGIQPDAAHAHAYRLTASEAVAQMRSGELTVEAYAKALLYRIQQRDDAVRAWAYLNPERVLEQARALDRVPKEERGPLHGVAVGVKDVIYTKDMPTQHNSPIYKDDAPKLDSGSIIILRNAGALIFGKTVTTEFAATVQGSKTLNAHSPHRTPGGSSSGSGAAVGDLQAPLALGTQTGGSTIRPGSFNGVYAYKPTWNAVSREGQKIYSLILDTLGIYSRSVADLELLADVFGIEDDEESQFGGVKGAKIAVCKTMVWSHAGEGTKLALDKAASLLTAHGATVEHLTLPPEFDKLPEWHRAVLYADGKTAFLPEYRMAKDLMAASLQGHVENVHKLTHRQHLEAFDGIARLRSVMDELASGYDAILTPSVPDEAPLGQESTGSAVFNSIWTALHTPVVNIPGFQGANGMPIGLSVVAGRYQDRHLLKVSKAVGEIFEAEGGWKRAAE